MVIFGKLLKLVISGSFNFLMWLGLADSLSEYLIHLYMSNVSVTKSGKMRANVYVLLTTPPVDVNKHVDSFITEYNILPGKKIIRISESRLIRTEYVLHPQLKIYLIRAIVRELEIEDGDRRWKMIPAT